MKTGKKLQMTPLCVCVEGGGGGGGGEGLQCTHILK